MHLSLQAEVTKKCVSCIYGYGMDCITTVPAMVRFVQCTFMCEEKYILWIGDNSAIKNALVAKDRIWRLFVPLEAWTLPHHGAG